MSIVDEPLLTAAELEAQFSENALTVLSRRYLRKDENGELAESLGEMFRRVAHHVAQAETANGDPQAAEDFFYRLLTRLRFVPNSPTFTGAGTPLGQLAACFVLPIADDMGKKPGGIFQSLRDAALIQQTGGGNGFSFSRLRPKESLVLSSMGQATGPVGFLRVYDRAFGEIAQGGSRRGANMAVLRVDHPDIAEFVTCKTSEDAITNFNISVGMLDDFMAAVDADEEWTLKFPDVADPAYRDFHGTLEDAAAAGIPLKSYQPVRARDLFDKIARQAWRNGEPGMLFLDTAQQDNPVPNLGNYECTNPCVTGETLLYTEHGLRHAVDLAQKNNSLHVITDSRLGSETLMPATPVFETGVKDVFLLVTREGYEIRLTNDHKLMTPNGWVEVALLQPGDQVYILDRKGSFGIEGTLDEGLILGWLVGDGTINTVRAVLSFFGDEKRELAPLFAKAVDNLVNHLEGQRSRPVGVVDIPERDEARVSSSRLGKWVAGYGLTENKFIVPDAVFMGSEDVQRGFLQALFTADGQVNDGGDKGCSVRLSSSYLPLLKDVQRLLLNFGIASRIYEERRPEGDRFLPDGHGGLKEYHCRAQHDLAISKTNLIRFANEIGFLTKSKRDKLTSYLARLTRGPYQETFMATVSSIESDGREMVYDLQQQETHSFIANGLVVHNCGEQFLLPYENCCLGSVNLARHLTTTADGDPGVDWDKLAETVHLATRFLDDVVSANSYVPAVPQLRAAAQRTRRIGLGIMGLADLLYHLRLRYGNQDAQEAVAQVMEFVRYHTMQASVTLAEQRGPFPAIEGSRYDPQDLIWQPPQWPQWLGTEPRPLWERPALDWDALRESIREHGIRNAAQLTIAPTGTIATVAGAEGYGCEPAFALAYTRYVHEAGEKIALHYLSPSFAKALAKEGLDADTQDAIFQQVLLTGSCQTVTEIPDSLREVFVTAGDVPAEGHIHMQAALQAFTDASISKTINFPASATPEDIADAFRLAWRLGCKGLTVYVAGSREHEVLETEATRQQKDAGNMPQPAPPQPWEGPAIRPRPRRLTGRTYRMATPVGTAFVTVNSNGDQQPFEVFLNVAKAGSETAAMAEAIGRLISLVLRLPSPLEPQRRLEEIAVQLGGIGGGRPLGFGHNRVLSLPDGVARALNDYLKELEDDGGEVSPAGPEQPRSQLNLFPVGDLCPVCGQATMVYTEGCQRCYACGHSEC